MDVPRDARRDPSSTDDLASLETLLDTYVIVLEGILTLSYMCRMNTCLVDSVVSLNPLGLLVHDKMLTELQLVSTKTDVRSVAIGSQPKGC